MGGYIGARSGTISATVANVQDVTATDSTPEVTIVNNTHEDTDQGREGKVIFKGQQSGGEESTLAEIEANHHGSSDDEKANLIFRTNDGSDGASPTEAMRITSQQRIGIGESSPDTNLHIKSATPIIRLEDSDTSAYGEISASSGDGNMFIKADEGNGVGSSGIRFHIDGSHVGRFQGTSFFLAKTSAGVSSSGGELRNGDNDYAVIGTSNGYSPFICNRKTSDGNLFVFRQDNSNEGIISVSGSTVTYGGFSGLHESSGIPPNTPIGTVVSTIDELDVYPNTQDGETHPKAGQTRADHAKVEVSNTVGDSAVYGVVTRFDDDGKVMVGSVGIGSVRVTGACAKGDLLESNGDGTTKVQSDDVVRSKTIGKVTIGNSSTDVKLVSCVLYCG
jgi:hypothetical protein